MGLHFGLPMPTFGTSRTVKRIGVWLAGAAGFMLVDFVVVVIALSPHWVFRSSFLRWITNSWATSIESLGWLYLIRPELVDFSLHPQDVVSYKTLVPASVAALMIMWPLFFPPSRHLVGLAGALFWVVAWGYGLLPPCSLFGACIIPNPNNFSPELWVGILSVHLLRTWLIRTGTWREYVFVGLLTHAVMLATLGAILATFGTLYLYVWLLPLANVGMILVPSRRAWHRMLAFARLKRS